MPAHTERLHARCSASGFKRWSACPGSIRAQEGLSDEKGEAAAAGTAAHEAAERMLRDPSATYDGPDELRGAATLYVDTVRELMAEHPGAELLIEVACDLTHLDPDLGGTCDAIVRVPFGPLFVIDLKTGRHPVEDHGQLALYALAAQRGHDPSEVWTVIAQGSADHPDGPVRRQHWTPDELATLAIAAREAAMATRDPDAPLVAGDHCVFCRAKGRCAALSRHLVAKAGADFDAPAHTPPPPGTLTGDELGRVLRLGATIGAWVEACREEARRRLRDGCSVDGYKLVEGRRAWREPAAAAAAIGAAGIEPYTSTLRTVAQVEEDFVERAAIAAGGKRGAKKAAAELFAELFADHFDRASAFPILAQATDRRRALTFEPTKAAALDMTAADDL